MSLLTSRLFADVNKISRTTSYQIGPQVRMLANSTKHAMVVTRSMSRALISSTPASRQHQEFQDVPSEKQFRLQLNSKYAYVDYIKVGNVYDLHHTEVPKEYEGKGIGRIIAQKTFDHIASTNSRMILTCEYLAHVYKKFGDKYMHIVD